ncbi:hypothetical protein FRX31_029005 [Thalictrum thalictroides]|uniref:Defensin-like protein n=1 Tax=Thalictrum thalictroides TaxID=46969 RepID=A0A7J6V9G6_THATH|nr:hypothetical protein FRX31_029005 [Thalictrum thalictroides]
MAMRLSLLAIFLIWALVIAPTSAEQYPPIGKNPPTDKEWCLTEGCYAPFICDDYCKSLKFEGGICIKKVRFGNEDCCCQPRKS